MLDFSTIKYPTAIKDHKCSLCGGTIHAGEKYIRFSGRYDGEMFDIKHHELCNKLVAVYCDWEGENEYTEDDIINMIRERVCWDCNHYNKDMDDFEYIDCNPYNCKKVIAELLEGGAQ